MIPVPRSAEQIHMFSEKGRLGVLRHGTVLVSLLLPVQQYLFFFHGAVNWHIVFLKTEVWSIRYKTAGWEWGCQWGVNGAGVLMRNPLCSGGGRGASELFFSLAGFADILLLLYENLFRQFKLFFHTVIALFNFKLLIFFLPLFLQLCLCGWWCWE